MNDILEKLPLELFFADFWVHVDIWYIFMVKYSFNNIESIYRKIYKLFVR